MSKIAVNETYGGNTAAQGHRLLLPPRRGAGLPSPRSRRATRPSPPPSSSANALAARMSTTTSTTRPIPTCCAWRSPRSSGAASCRTLVALLSGRNFETKQYEEAIAEDSFGRLKSGILRLHQQDALRPHHDDPALGGLRHAAT